MKRVAIFPLVLAAAGCAPEPPVGKGFILEARAEHSYGECQVRLGETAYKVTRDLDALRDDMRARFGSRMHLLNTEVRVQSLGFTPNSCGARAVDALHRAGFVRIALADARPGVTKR